MVIKKSNKISNISQHNANIKIIQFAQEKFMKEGFAKITMNEIAKSLSISKGTLYSLYNSKTALLEDSVLNFIENIDKKIKIILCKDENAVLKFINIITLLTSNISKISDKFLREIQTNAPHLWEKIDEKRKELLFENIGRLIKQGQNEKLIQSYPSEIIITFFIGAIRNIVNPNFLISISYSYEEAAKYAFKIFLNGILTEKGKKIFNKRIL
jgi:AcrR family transcriptional regulator